MLVKKSKSTVLIIVFTLLLAAIVLFSSLNHRIDDKPTAGNLQAPESMKELSESEQCEWMCGILAEPVNCSLHSGAYELENEQLQISVTMQNGLNKTQCYYLMILADGIPMGFSICGSNYISYPLLLSSDILELEISVVPDFSLGLGRLDVLLLYGENPASDYHINTQTLWFHVESEAKKTQNLYEAASQRIGLAGRFSDGAYGAWLWEAGSEIQESDSIGPRSQILATEGDALLLEVVASQPGLYRTIMLLNYIPMSIAQNEIYYVDWESTGENMLQIPITFSGELGGSFFTISTPIRKEDQESFPVASYKIPIIDSKRG